MRTSRQVGAPENFRSFNEGLDNIAGDFGISRQPAFIETPASRNAAFVESLMQNILRGAEPIQRRTEVRLVVARNSLPSSSGYVFENEPEML
ncbi:MAG: hypothetical protein JO095_17880 [Alphaproteobacteria bacterium]|nr:hypothetical protein [Alphaproteobacteria bacterium]